MFSRVDTGSVLGGSMVGAGTVVEVSKKGVQDIDIMQVDVLFGLIPGYYLHLGGLIAIVGVIILIHSSIRGHREKKRREQRDKLG